jgi:hypothetical protein
MCEGSVSLWPMISIAIISRVKPVSVHVQCLRHLPFVSGGQSRIFSRQHRVRSCPVTKGIYLQQWALNVLFLLRSVNPSKISEIP